MSLYYQNYSGTMNNLLDEIRKIMKINKGIKTIVISYYDGNPIISSATDAKTTSILAAVSAAIRNIAEKTSSLTSSGDLKKVIMHYIQDKIILVSLNSTYNVLVRAREDAPIGVILRDVSLLIDKIRKNFVK